MKVSGLLAGIKDGNASGSFPIKRQEDLELHQESLEAKSEQSVFIRLNPIHMPILERSCHHWLLKSRSVFDSKEVLKFSVEIHANLWCQDTSRQYGIFEGVSLFNGSVRRRGCRHYNCFVSNNNVWVVRWRRIQGGRCLWNRSGKGGGVGIQPLERVAVASVFSNQNWR